MKYLFLVFLLSSCAVAHRPLLKEKGVSIEKNTHLLVDFHDRDRETTEKFILDFSHLPFYLAVNDQISEPELKQLYQIRGKIELLFALRTDFRYPLSSGNKDDALNQLQRLSYKYQKMTENSGEILYLPYFRNISGVAEMLKNAGWKRIFARGEETGTAILIPPQELPLFTFSQYSSTYFRPFILVAGENGLLDFQTVIEEEKLSYIEEFSRTVMPGEEILFAPEETLYRDLFNAVRKTVEKYKNSGRADPRRLGDIMTDVYLLEEGGDISKGKDKKQLAVGRIYKSMGENLPMEVSRYFSGSLYSYRSLSIEVDGIREDMWNESQGYQCGDVFFSWAQDDKNYYFIFPGTAPDFQIYFKIPSPFFYSLKTPAGMSGDFSISYYLEKKGEKFQFYRANSDDSYSYVGGLYQVVFSSSYLELALPQSFFRERLGGEVRFRVMIEGRCYSSGNLFLFSLSDEPGLVFRFLDPVEDARGPGWYRLPLEGVRTFSQVDIREFLVKKTASDVILECRLGEISPEMTGVFVDIYIDINREWRRGSMELLPERKAYADDYSCWEYALSFRNGSGRLYKYELDSFRESGAVVSYISSTRLQVKIPSEMVAGDPEKWGFIVLSGFVSGEPADILEVKKEADAGSPGGGDPERDSPNIFDILAESVADQKEILGSYLKKKGAKIKAISR